jgi:hypothetical protein
MRLILRVKQNHQRDGLSTPRELLGHFISDHSGAAPAV